MCTNLIHELGYLFFLLTVLACVKSFSPVVNTFRSGLNRKTRKSILLKDRITVGCQRKNPQLMRSNKDRLRRWSFFFNDGMVLFFSQGTIVIDGFSMVFPPLNHHHWMFFYRSTIEIDSFSMIFPNSGAMVSDGFDLKKDLKMCIIVTDPILRKLCLLFRIQITLLLVNFMCK